MASQIRIFDSNFTDGGETTFLYYNRTRSADDAPHTTKYFNVNNVIHDNLIGMNSVADSSGTFTNGNRYYSRTKADLSNFNNSLIEASKTTSGDSFLWYISLVGNELDSNVLVNSVAQTGYPIYYPIPIEFVGFNGISSDHNSYNANYASGFKTVKYTSSSGNYSIVFNNRTYNYSSFDAWHNGQITLSAGSNYIYYLCTSLTLKQNYYVWDSSDSVSFDVVVYLFNNLGYSTNGFPWRNASYLTKGTPITNSNYKYTVHTVGSYTLSLNNECKIDANTIRSKINTGDTMLKSSTIVYFGHGYIDSNKSTNKFSFDPTKWGYFLRNGVDSPLPSFISSNVCTTNNYSLSRKGVTFACPNFGTPETDHFCNIPIIIKGTKTQETGSTNDSRPVFYSIGFIGLRNVKYNIATSVSSNWINPFPNDAITYYKYLCLEQYNPSEYTGMNAVSSANSYFMINNGKTVYIVNTYSHAYVQSYNAQVTSNFITLSYSYSYV